MERCLQAAQAYAVPAAPWRRAAPSPEGTGGRGTGGLGTGGIAASAQSEPSAGRRPRRVPLERRAHARRFAAPPVLVVLYFLLFLAFAATSTATELRADGPDPDAASTDGAKPETKKDGPGKHEFPWKLDRAYRYSWKVGKESAGSLTLVFREKRDAAGTRHVLEARRSFDHEGSSQRAKGELLFDGRTGRPFEYREESQVTRAKKTGQQELQVRFSAKSAKSRFIPNGNTENAAEHETEVDDTTRLFATNALEHWVIFLGPLAKREKISIPVYYPEFAKVLRIDFSPAADDETLKVGDETLRVRRFDFVYREYPKDHGKVWVDDAGRMIRYESASMRLELDAL
jgi:hypothetical protein